MPCPKVTHCRLFSRFKVRASLGIWAVYYCEGKFETCSRLRLYEQGAEVPDNMLPNGRLLAGTQPTTA